MMNATSNAASIAPISNFRRIARAGWLLLLVGTISLYVIRQAYDGPYGKDFTIFLTGAHMVVGGEGASLYDLGAQATAQEPIKGPYTYPGGVLPFNYPPYVAAFMSPLALLTPEAAYYAWLIVQFLVLVGLTLSIKRQGLGGEGPVLLALVTFAPIVEALLMGQMSLMLLLLWWWAFLSWRGGNWVALGVAVSLSAFKPQMAALLIAALAAQKMWRSLAVVVGVQAFLWGAAMLAFGLGILGSYIEMLKLSGTTTGTLGFYPDYMTNLRGLLATLGVGADLGLQLAFVAWVGSLGTAAWVWRRARWSLAARFGITAALAVVFSPHLYIHDASLLMLAPLCLYVAHSERGSIYEMDRLLLPFAALFAGVYVVVLRIVPSYVPLIVAVMFCAVTMLYLLIRSGERPI